MFALSLRAWHVRECQYMGCQAMVADIVRLYDTDQIAWSYTSGSLAGRSIGPDKGARSLASEICRTNIWIITRAGRFSWPHDLTRLCWPPGPVIITDVLENFLSIIITFHVQVVFFLESFSKFFSMGSVDSETKKSVDVGPTYERTVYFGLWKSCASDLGKNLFKKGFSLFASPSDTRDRQSFHTKVDWLFTFTLQIPLNSLIKGCGRKENYFSSPRLWTFLRRGCLLVVNPLIGWPHTHWIMYFIMCLLWQHIKTLNHVQSKYIFVRENVSNPWCDSIGCLSNTRIITSFLKIKLNKETEIIILIYLSHSISTRQDIFS